MCGRAGTAVCMEREHKQTRACIRIGEHHRWFNQRCLQRCNGWDLFVLGCILSIAPRAQSNRFLS